MKKTKDILSLYKISRQSLYNWIKYDNLKVNRNIRGHYMWDDESIANLESFIYQRKKINVTPKIEKSSSFSLNNRRYLGSKHKLLPFINRVISTNTNNVNTIADVFAGTGTVADYYFNQGKQVIINDILKSNFTIYNAFFGNNKVNKRKIKKYINKMNSLTLQKNYVSEHYGNRYFSLDNAMKIGEAREFIENIKDINNREKDILITSIIFAMDKVANTVGHYDAYRRKLDMIDPIFFRIPNYYSKRTDNVHIFSEDANQLVRNITPDLVYIDTPYNSRQYGDIYHVLENITTWNKPELFGVAQKPRDRAATKSSYSTSHAPEAFSDLINNIHARYVLVSYNNMAQKGAGRSNAKISNEEILETLRERGNVTIFEENYKAFTTGKSDIHNHKELLYLLEVNNG